MVLSVKKIIYNTIQKIRKKKVKLCGGNVRIAKKCRIQGNIELGNNIVIGEGALLVSSIATIKVHDYVVFGPNVTIYTGDHQTNILGKHIIEIREEDKNNKNLDKDVIIESGCWIGTRAIILKGVTIGKGSIIGAGAVVTKNIPPYSVYVGVPSSKILKRFTKEEIDEHERILFNRGIQPNSFLGV